MPIPVCETRPI